MRTPRRRRLPHAGVDRPRIQACRTVGLPSGAELRGVLPRIIVRVYTYSSRMRFLFRALQHQYGLVCDGTPLELHEGQCATWDVCGPAAGLLALTRSDCCDDWHYATTEGGMLMQPAVGGGPDKLRPSNKPSRKGPARPDDTARIPTETAVQAEHHATHPDYWQVRQEPVSVPLNRPFCVGDTVSALVGPNPVPRTSHQQAISDAALAGKLWTGGPVDYSI